MRWIPRQARHRIGVGRVAQNRLHVGGGLPGFDCRHALEVGPRGVRELERKVKVTQPCQAAGKMGDRVVLHRHRTVAAAIGHFQRVGLEHLFAGLDGHALRFAIAGEQPGRTFIQGEVGVDQGPVVLQQVLGAVEFRRDDLLIAGKRDDQVALGPVALLLVADQVIEKNRRHRLVVEGATGVEVAVLLDQLERVALPILAPGLDHIEVAEQKDRLFRAGAAVARDEVAFLRRARWNDDLHVARRNAARGEPRAHRLSGGCATAGRVGGVDLDQFLVKLAQPGLGRCRALRVCGEATAQQNRNDDLAPDSIHDFLYRLKQRASLLRCSDRHRPCGRRPTCGPRRAVRNSHP